MCIIGFYMYFIKRENLFNAEVRRVRFASAECQWRIDGDLAACRCIGRKKYRALPVGHSPRLRNRVYGARVRDVYLSFLIVAYLDARNYRWHIGVSAGPIFSSPGTTRSKRRLSVDSVTDKISIRLLLRIMQLAICI